MNIFLGRFHSGKQQLSLEMFWRGGLKKLLTIILTLRVPYHERDLNVLDQSFALKAPFVVAQIIRSLSKHTTVLDSVIFSQRTA
jgi:hypothetical protein